MAAQCTHLQSKEKRSWVWKKKATAILWFFHPKTRRGENISGRSDGLAAGNYASWYLKFSVEKWAWLIWYALKFNENCPTRNFFRSVRSLAPPTILSFFRFVCWLCFGSLQNTLARWCEREQCSHCICEEKQRPCVLYAQWISRERPVQCARTRRFSKTQIPDSMAHLVLCLVRFIRTVFFFLFFTSSFFFFFLFLLLMLLLVLLLMMVLCVLFFLLISVPQTCIWCRLMFQCADIWMHNCSTLSIQQAKNSW